MHRDCAPVVDGAGARPHLVFDRGQIAEEGSHAALMRVAGPYQALFTHQAAGLLEV